MSYGNPRGAGGRLYGRPAPPPQIRRSERVAVRTTRAGSVFDLSCLPSTVVVVVQLYRLGWTECYLQRCWAGKLRQHAQGPSGHSGSDQQHHLDRGYDHLPGCHRAGPGHGFERQGAREAGIAVDLLYTCRAATGCGRLDLGLALQPAVRCDQLLPAPDRAGQPRSAVAWARTRPLWPQ